MKIYVISATRGINSLPPNTIAMVANMAFIRIIGRCDRSYSRRRRVSAGTKLSTLLERGRIDSWEILPCPFLQIVAVTGKRPLRFRNIVDTSCSTVATVKGHVSKRFKSFRPHHPASSLATSALQVAFPPWSSNRSRRLHILHLLPRSFRLLP